MLKVFVIEYDQYADVDSKQLDTRDICVALTKQMPELASVTVKQVSPRGILSPVELAMAVSRGYTNECRLTPPTSLVQSISDAITDELEERYSLYSHLTN